MNLESKHLSPTTSLANLFDGYLFMSIFPFVTRTPRLRNQARAQHKGASRPSCRCANSRRVEGRRLGLTYIFTSRSSLWRIEGGSKVKNSRSSWCGRPDVLRRFSRVGLRSVQLRFPIFHLPRLRFHARSSKMSVHDRSWKNHPPPLSSACCWLLPHMTLRMT